MTSSCNLEVEFFQDRPLYKCGIDFFWFLDTVTETEQAPSWVPGLLLFSRYSVLDFNWRFPRPFSGLWLSIAFPGFWDPLAWPASCLSWPNFVRSLSEADVKIFWLGSNFCASPRMSTPFSEELRKMLVGFGVGEKLIGPRPAAQVCSVNN